MERRDGSAHAAQRIDGAGDRTDARRHRQRYPVLLIDGVVGEVWHQRRTGKRLAITVEPLHELTATQRRQLDDEVALVGAVMEAEATLTMGKVEVGPHA